MDMPTVSQTTALRAQSAPPCQITCVFRANQHAHVFEVRALSHGIANRASADIKTKHKPSEKWVFRFFIRGNVDLHIQLDCSMLCPFDDSRQQFTFTNAWQCRSER